MTSSTPDISPLAAFRPPTRAWFDASFAAPTAAQALAWPAVARGESALLLAPTGSGKTLAAFLAALDRVMFDPVPPPRQRCRVVYVSPLKALAVDIERNLRAPLIGLARQAERLGVPFHTPEIAVRTGDTPPRERQRFARQPSDILITTPESLYLILTSQAREAVAHAEWLILDEIHALAGTKRGAHLAVSVERLAELCGRPLQRIGLSATARPPEEIARFLGGHGDDAAPRAVSVLDAGARRRLDLHVMVPVEDMAKLGDTLDDAPRNAAGAAPRRSIWPAVHPRLLEMIRAHRSTLLFVNSRRLAERLAAALNELAGEEIVFAHHGSVSREQRAVLEERLKAGTLPALVATSSLELGIDMGAIDLVIQVEAPPGVASALQRIGRAGHQVGAASSGVLVPKFRGDLLACAALTERMLDGAVEHTRVLRTPLDVLAQQIVAMVAVEPWHVDAAFAVLRRAAPFATLTRGVFEQVLDMLAGRYPSSDFAELRPRITWDRATGQLTARDGARHVAVTSGGTIPDRGLYGVYLVGAAAGQGRVGELDEEMVFESREGETFTLGASTWRIEEITPDRVLVTPAPGEPGKMPFWIGDTVGRPLDFGRAIGALTRAVRGAAPADAERTLRERHFLDAFAARNVVQYLADQAAVTGAVPDDRTLVVERSVDDLGDWRVVILSPFGGRVHAPWGLAIAETLRRCSQAAVEVLWTDDGIVVRFPESDEPPDVTPLFPTPEEAEQLVVAQLGATTPYAKASGDRGALFAARFRENAARALLLPRRGPGKRNALWRQRRRAADLLQAISGHGDFPIVLETYRECLQDVFDMPGLHEILGAVARREIRVVTVDTASPSPFAASVLYSYVVNFMYEGDAPVAERRAQALTVDPAQLRELLGEAELRELLDPAVVETCELALQHLTPERAARHVDHLHDLLLHLGDLTHGELAARCAEAAAPWLDALRAAGRVVEIALGGESRCIAVEDVARYRDALGVPPPPGVPAAFLTREATPPLRDLVARFARTHAPFTAADIATRWGIGEGAVTCELEALESMNRLVHGAFRPGGSGREWCDVQVLATLRQRSLARLRHAVEPVDGEAFARFALAWHGVDEPRAGDAALADALEQLEGMPLAASECESAVLRARVADYRPEWLDAALLSGAWVWRGAGALGSRDGWIAFHRADAVPPPGGTVPDGALHAAIRAALDARGAVFFPVLQAATGRSALETLDALWDLVWAGEVTNDSLQPLRALMAARRATAASATARWRAPIRRRVWRRAVGRSLATGVAPAAAGRWSLLRHLSAPATATQLAHRRALQLLARAGVVTRDVVRAEDVPGGFTALYPVFRALEEAGTIRRGYFVASLGASQFAWPRAVDQLRAHRDAPEASRAVLLAACDPANPYGTTLRWPEHPRGVRPPRAVGAHVVLVDGACAAYLARGERALWLYEDAGDERGSVQRVRAIAEVLATHLAPRRRRGVVLDEIDGAPAEETRYLEQFRAAGFARVMRGLRVTPRHA